jgi:hypothetical protein
MTKGFEPMRFTKLSLFIAGAVGILMLGVPRAAHAVAAALVQVANTASNPVITQSISQQAAQIVQIECGYLPGSGIGGQPPVLLGCVAVPATGVFSYGSPQVYVVPAGETLVVTSVDILSGAVAGTPCMSSAFPQMSTEAPAGPASYLVENRKAWIVPAGAGTVQYVYPSGILFSTGTIIEGVDSFVGPCTLTVDLHGYLTAQ